MDVLTSRTIIHPSDLDRPSTSTAPPSDLAVAREFGQGPGRGVVFFAGGGLIEVVAGDRGGRRPGGAGRPPGPVALWLQVRSIEAAVAELAGRGVPVVRPPLLEPWGLIEAWIDDPDGLRIHLVEVPARPSSPAATPGSPSRRDGR